jgi:hypothetical protein
MVAAAAGDALNAGRRLNPRRRPQTKNARAFYA